MPIHRPNPVAACISAFFALALTGERCHAATLPVTNCADDGSAGSLRSVIAAAASGDTIDLSALTCGTAGSNITLQAGEISIPTAKDLTLQGPHVAPPTFAISAGFQSRVFNQVGGSLTLKNLVVTEGKYYSIGRNSGVGGGCIVASSVSLVDTIVTNCQSVSKSTTSGDIATQGGAIYAANVNLQRSTVSHGATFSRDTTSCCSGGAGIKGRTVVVLDSTVSNNYTHVIPGARLASGGGISASSLTMSGSSVFNNGSDAGGGIYLEGGTGSSSIQNSTISANSTTYRGGGIENNFQPLTVQNSTVAFNDGIGLYDEAGTLKLQSVILANNTNADLRTGSASVPTTIDHCLISGFSSVPLPTGTITADPQLAPLATHGGSTMVHALSSSSPAVDAGSNPAALSFDQRETGFARSVGTASDIGAYERQVNDDEIFYSGFEH